MSNKTTVLFQGIYALAEKVATVVGHEPEQYILYVNPVSDMWLEHLTASVQCGVAVDTKLSGNVARVVRVTPINSTEEQA